MFIQTETTPNPATLKFLPGKVVMPEGTADFRDAASAANTSPLAAKLFAVPGVTGVFFGYDFITVTKTDGEWQHLKPAILGTIMEHFMSGAPVMANNGNSNAAAEHDDGEFYDAADTEIVATIKELIETRVRPAVAQDGGDILFNRFDADTGVVWLHMRGACSGCPSSSATLKAGVENMLKHYVPEVTRVEQTL